jgi:hypothetical protein
MSDSATETWISVAQSPIRKQLAIDALLFLLLSLASAAVANRERLCQLQAYAVLLVSLAAVAFYAHYCQTKREATVETLRKPYCVDCHGESRGALVVGRRSSEVASAYERMHVPLARRHIFIVIWLAWIAYGSIFHEAQHELEEDSVLQTVSHSAATAHYVRWLRVFALWFIAMLDTLRRSTLHIGWASAVFYLLLFFPSHDSTPQALSGAELFARTALFLTLAVLSEALQRVEHYCQWIEGYDNTYQTHLAGLLMALGQAMPLKPRVARTSDQLFIPILDPGVAGRDFSLTVYLVNWRLVLRAAWILVSCNAAIGFALLQAAVIFYRYCAARHTIRSLAVRKTKYLRLAEFGADVTRQTLHENDEATLVLKPQPKPKRPTKSASPPPPAVAAPLSWAGIDIGLDAEAMARLQELVANSSSNAVEAPPQQAETTQWRRKKTHSLNRI